MALYVGVTCLDWAADEVGLLEEAGHRHFLNDDVTGLAVELFRQMVPVTGKVGMVDSGGHESHRPGEDVSDRQSVWNGVTEAPQGIFRSHLTPHVGRGTQDGLLRWDTWAFWEVAWCWSFGCCSTTPSAVPDMCSTLVFVLTLLPVNCTALSSRRCFFVESPWLQLIMCDGSELQEEFLRKGK